MIKNEGMRLWVNRIVAFLSGGLIVLVLMSAAAVAPVKGENAALKTQLEEAQFGASKLLSEARTLAEAKNYGNAQRVLNTLFEKHPGTNEAVDGRKLYEAVDATVKEMDRKWEAASVAVRAEWEAKAARDLRAKLEDARMLQEKEMTATLDTAWNKASADVRLAWENPKK